MYFAKHAKKNLYTNTVMTLKKERINGNLVLVRIWFIPVQNVTNVQWHIVINVGFEKYVKQVVERNVKEVTRLRNDDY